MDGDPGVSVSIQGVHVRQKISHGCWFHLKTWHGRCFSTDDLMNQLRILEAIGDADQLRTEEPLASETVTAGAVDPKQLPAMVR